MNLEVEGKGLEELCFLKRVLMYRCGHKRYAFVAIDGGVASDIVFF